MNQSKSIIKRLSILVNVIWYAELIASVVFIGAIILGAIIRKKFMLIIPVDFNTINLHKFEPLHNAFPFARLDGNAGNFVFQLNTTWLNLMSMIAVYMILIGFVIAITFQVRKIFLNFKNTHLFSRTNVYSVRIISILIIIFPFVKWLIYFVINYILNENFMFKRFELLNTFNFGFLLTGLVLLSVVEIFRLGMELEEEQKLTV